MARINEEQHTVREAGTSRPPRSGRSGRWTRWLRRILAGLLVLLLAASAGLVWVLRSETGKYFWEKAARYQFEPGTPKELFDHPQNEKAISFLKSVL